MSRATLISRIVFALLVLATFTAFFAAQRLKRTDSLVYAVNLKKYVSPNHDGRRERARLRFRTKQTDVVTVEVIDRNGETVRVLADQRKLAKGVHKFQWNGSYRTGYPVPDGAYRVRIAMKRSGRTFVPDKFFVVDTAPPQLTVNVAGSNTVSALRGSRPRSVRVDFSGISASRRVELLVYRVAGQRTAPRAVAGFASVPGQSFGRWNLTVGQYKLRPRSKPCTGSLVTRGKPRPAPPGKYVIVARSCDAAGNRGASSTKLPPVRGTTEGRPGLTLRGVELAPPMRPLVVGRVASFNVNPPVGGYSYRLRRIGGGEAASGRAHGPRLRLRVPRVPRGLYELEIRALEASFGERGSARTPLAITDRRRAELLVVYPAIAWQATNPVDVNGDGYGDGYEVLPPGKQLRVRLDRTLATPAMPQGFGAQEGALARSIAAADSGPTTEVTTDYALAAAPDAALRGRHAVVFAGDERWITPQLGAALRKFVARGGNVGFFSLDAFRRTVSLTGEQMTGPSERRQRDIFGEAVVGHSEAPAPVVRFVDQLGLMRGPAGLFTRFEEAQRGKRDDDERFVSAGRQPVAPALEAYSPRAGGGLVIRVGVRDWLAQAVGSRADANVAYTTGRILQLLAERRPQR